jgi:hypothetical protein
LNSLQILINAEAARRQRTIHVAASDVPTNTTPRPAIAASAEVVVVQASEINKTDMVREILRQHPAGITPTEIWKEVKNQMSHRAYLYSILGRLKDRDEVLVRRKKYFPKAIAKTPEGEKTHVSVN